MKKRFLQFIYKNFTNRYVVKGTREDEYYYRKEAIKRGLIKDVLVRDIQGRMVYLTGEQHIYFGFLIDHGNYICDFWPSINQDLFKKDNWATPIMHLS